jgi:aspartyl-tRNA(Asn)/glutamyl-tRNA(Gln) amidotransferase subunit C
MDIDHIARLARIDLTDAEKAQFGAQLDSILDYFERIQQVDVDGIEPTAHAFAVENVWRTDDEPGPTLPVEVLRKMAPAERDNEVVVPKVVE